MFQLMQDEWESLRSQFVTLENGRGKYPKYLPFAFTEQGVAMLSSVLNSSTAIKVNIQIIRIFTKMREMLLTNTDILLKLEKLEKAEQLGGKIQTYNQEHCSIHLIPLNNITNRLYNRIDEQNKIVWTSSDEKIKGGTNELR